MFRPIFRQLLSDLQAIKPSLLDLRNFGLILSLIIVVYGIWAQFDLALYFLGISVVVAAISLFKTSLLKVIYFPLMTVGTVIGFTVLRILLTIIFFVLFLPTGLLNRRSKRKLLLHDNLLSYWHDVS